MSNDITKDNIAEVLEFNKSLGLEVDNIRIRNNRICFNCRGCSQEFEFDDDGGTKWLQHIEIETGKLKPLPKANPFDVVKVGDWVKSKKTLYHYQCQLPYRTKDKWYQRVELNNKKCFVCNSNGSGYSSSDSPCDWDLTDIRDYNPTECELKVGDVIEFDISHQVVKIVEFNYLNKSIVDGTGFITFDSIDYVAQNCTINGRKYDKITIPKFDFVKCLVDAGFKIADDCLYVGKSFDDALIWFNSSTGRLNVGMYIKPTPANAQIIVSMANLAKGIK